MALRQNYILQPAGHFEPSWMLLKISPPPTQPSPSLACSFFFPPAWAAGGPERQDGLPDQQFPFSAEKGQQPFKPDPALSILQLKDGNKKAMLVGHILHTALTMRVGHTLHTALTTRVGHIVHTALITHQLASPGQLFLLRADFSLPFLFSLISTYQISWSQPYRIGQA